MPVCLEYLFYPFTLSIPVVKVCFLDVEEGWILFSQPFYNFVSLYHFIGGIEAIDVGKYQRAVFADSGYVVDVVASLCVYVCVFPLF